MNKYINVKDSIFFIAYMAKTLQRQKEQSTQQDQRSTKPITAVKLLDTSRYDDPFQKENLD